MRFAVFVFSLVLTLMPVYVYAFAFVPAAVGGLVRTAGGAVVKVASKKNLTTFAWGAMGASTPQAFNLVKNYCTKHSKKCKDWVGDTTEWLFDTNDNDTNQVCYYDGKQFKSTDDLCAYFFNKANARNNKSYVFATSYKTRDGYCLVYGGTNKFNGNVGAAFSCTDKQSIIIIKHTKEIIERIKDDDPDYIINNYGDTIDIEKYCASNACDELTANFGDEVMKNKDKYDIDKINKVNCEVENNKIKSCDNAKKEKDKKDDDEESNEEQTNKSDDDKIIQCDSTGFHKKVCDFIDWYQDDFEHDNQNTAVDVDDKTNDLPKHKDYVKFNAQCPPDKVINLSYAGISKSLNWTYRDFCQAMINLKPFVVGFSMISSAFILAGRKK